MIKYVAEKYPTRQLSVVSSVADSTIRGFLSFGQNNCNYAQMGAQQFQNGLMDMRTAMQSYKNFGTYYVGQCGSNPCSHHTWLMDNAHFYGTTVGGTALPDYVAALVSGSVSNVGP
jgi:hypothetical protein